MADFQTQHSVQAVGGVTINYMHPSLPLVADVSGGAGAAGVPGSTIPMKGFKLQSQFVDASSIVDNSIVIPILGGGSVQLTNNNLSGTLTFNCTRVSNSMKHGDIVSIAQQQIMIGDSVGATITLSWGFNGATFTITFFKCTVKNVPPVRLAGNDAPDYQVQFNFGTYTVG